LLNQGFCHYLTSLESSVSASFFVPAESWHIEALFLSSILSALDSLNVYIFLKKATAPQLALIECGTTISSLSILSR
jgi:hypothetical protein